MTPTLSALVQQHLAPLLRPHRPTARPGLLAAAIDQLPLQDKVVLSLYYDHGLTMVELAAVLDVTATELHALAVHAVAALQATLPARLGPRAVGVA